MRIHLILVALAAAALLDPSPILAQDADDVGHGREIAQTICAACHVVAKGQLERIPLTFTCSLRERKSWCIPAR
jgi:mono/diheme cytochrome c family protein